MLLWLEALAVVSSVAMALALRPWRSLSRDGPPWPWVAWAAVLPWFWGADRYVHVPHAQPLSGACLLMLMAGWPLAVLALVPVALATMVLAGLGPAEAVHRAVWLGIAPATVAMGLGAALRRWLPHHPFVYILGRGFFVTLGANVVAGLSGAWLAGAGEGDVMLGRWLAAWGDAWLCGFLVAIFVAYRPQWLATYADRIWLPPGSDSRG